VVTYWTIDYKQYKFYFGGSIWIGRNTLEKNGIYNVFVYHNVTIVDTLNNTLKKISLA